MTIDPGVETGFLEGLVAHLDPCAVLAAVRTSTGDLADLQFVAVNDTGCTFLEHSREHLLSHTLLETFPRHRDSRFYSALATVLETGVTLVWDDVEIESAVRPAGTRFDLRGTKVGHDLMVISWRDNSERAALMAALTASEARLRALSETTSDATLCSTPDGTITWASDSIERNFGWRPDQVVGHRVVEFLHPEDARQVETSRSQVLDSALRQMRARLRTGNGTYRWVSSKVHVEKDEAGNVVGLMAGWRDVHDEQMALLELQHMNERFDELVNLSSDTVATGDNAGVLTWVSDSVRRLTGWEPGEVVGRPFVEFIHPDDRDLVRTVQPRIGTGSTMTFEARFRTNLGDYRWISFQVRPQERDGVVVGRIAGWRDVHAEHETRDQLIRAEQRFHAAIRSAPIGTAVVDLERRMMMANPALCRMVGQPESALLTRKIGEILDPLDVPLDAQMRGRLLDTSQASVTTEMRLLHLDGSVTWVRHVMSAMRDERGRPWGYVSQFLDISDAIAARSALHYRATHDPLTQVGNRDELEQRIGWMLGQPSAEGRSSGVLFIDVDHLKEINDTHGHHVGDRVLIDVARAIRECTRADDAVARYGGDEFVVVIPGASSTDALVAVAAKIRDSVSRHVRADAEGIAATVSIGVALSQSLDDPETTMRHADEALYRAKQAGRDRIEAFVPPTTA